MSQNPADRYQNLATALDDLRLKNVALTAAEAALAESVRHAHALGASLKEIGDLLRVSKQTVRYRYFKDS